MSIVRLRQTFDNLDLNKNIFMVLSKLKILKI